MNLKIFHVLFIVAATLLSAGLGAWCLSQRANGGGAGMLIGGVLSFVVAGGLVIYGMWFLRKMRGL